MINSFQSGPDEWMHWVRVPENRCDEFYDWISVSIPDAVPNKQHSEPHNGVTYIVYRITVKNSAHNTLLMLTWG